MCCNLHRQNITSPKKEHLTCGKSIANWAFAESGVLGSLESDSGCGVDVIGSTVKVDGGVGDTSAAVLAELVALVDASAAAIAASCRFTSTIFSIGSLLVGVRGIYMRCYCSRFIFSPKYI